MSFPSSLAAAPPVSSLIDFPLLGPMIGWVDKVFADLGFLLWFRESVELVLLVFVVHRLTTWLVQLGLPWLAAALARPMLSLIDLARVLLLVPDLVVTRQRRLRSLPPPALVYTYGDAVLGFTDRLQTFVVRSFPAAENLRRLPGGLILAVVIVGFLFWNGTFCTGTDVSPGCTAPSERWVLAFAYSI